jgi:xanthine dehydrogenase YagT iron-sulfur-binding subunit
LPETARRPAWLHRPSQILSGIALLSEGPQSIEEIREGMSGNLCRCGAHANIVAAIAEVAGL